MSFAVGHESQKTSSGVLVLLVLFQMVGQIINSARQNSHLHLRTAGIAVVPLGFLYNSLLLILGKHGAILAQSPIFGNFGLINLIWGSSNIVGR